jgi:uncharacterized protein (TIGR03437 family)
MRFLLTFLLVTVGAQAATTLNTTMTVTNATVSLGTSVTVTGPVTLSGIGNGTFTATASILSIGTGTLISAPFTVTLSTGDKITGTLNIPASVFVGGATSGTGSATITGGTGVYVNATGSFPSLAGTTSGTLGSSNYTLSITGSGTIVTGGPGLPNITSVGDAASYGSGLAQGGLIVAKGTNLSPSGYFSQGFPLPTTAQSVKATLTPLTGGTGTDLYIIYLYNQNNVNQLALIVPSTTAPGAYNLTVTNNGATSSPVQVTVVKSAPQIFTQDSSGTGLAVVQNFVSASKFDVNRATTGAINGVTISPAHEGQTLIAWGTNLGPVPGGDNVASQGYDYTKNGHTVSAIIGGTTVPASYAGPSPGLAPTVAQINFVLPQGITGCAVNFQIQMDGVMSIPTFIDIAPQGADACVHPYFSRTQLMNFDNGGNYRWGQVSVEQLSENVPGTGSAQVGIVSTLFQEDNTFHLGIPLTQLIANITDTQCFVSIYTSSSGGSQGTLTNYGGINRDSGTVTLTGPAGSNFNKTVIPQQSDLSYSLITGLTGGTSGPTLVPGSYTAAGGSGVNVGQWSVTGTLAAAPSLTNLPTTVPRSSDLTITFPAATGFVEAGVSSFVTSGSGANTTSSGGSVVCIGPASAGKITLAGSDLSQLPASTNGGLTVLIGTPTVSFTAPAADGGSSFTSVFSAFSGIEQTVSVQ